MGARRLLHRWTIGEPVTRRFRRITLIGGVVLAVIIAFIVLSPQQVDVSGQQTLRAFLDRLHRSGALPAFITFGVIEAAANVVLFVPVGFVGAMLVRPRWRAWVVVAGALLSAAVEVGQKVFLPGRVASPRDVLANSIGVVVGVIVLARLSSWLSARAARRRATPTDDVAHRRSEVES